MKVMVIGGGGREHAIVWKIAQSPLVEKIISAPGNPGIAKHAETFPVAADDIDGLVDLAVREKVDLVVVGPELPLALGITDKLEEKGILVCGPSKEAAQLEGSKAFTKEILKKYGIPTADFRIFDDYEEAREYILSHSLPVVVKADGLAAGKGVGVCETFEEALAFLKKVMVDKAFGDAGNRVVIEECLFGEEASYIVFTDGEKIVPMPTSQDHKRIGDGDTGPNTGGMGAYSPAPVVTEEVEKKIQERVFYPLLEGMRKEGKPFKGILYGGLMIKDGEPYVLEFNVRFGDPEAQPLVVRIKNDMVPILVDCAEGKLGDHTLEIDDRASVCVVMASGGYPGPYEKGFPITGIDEAEKLDDVVVFQAGTKLEDGRLLSWGGRVLGVTALGNTIRDAISRAYQAVEKISWDGAYYRRDIGHRALAREEK